MTILCTMRMRRALTALILGSVIPSTAWSETLNGTYASPGMAIVVQFDQCDGSPEMTCGTLVWGWDGEADLKVSFGVVIAPLLRQTETGWAGRLTDPVSGRTFRGTITPAGNGELLLRGCAGPFCSTERWYSLDRLEAAFERLRGPER